MMMIMSHIFENPFTPESAIPTKRLFGGEEEVVKRKLGREAKKRIKETKEQFAKVKYGDHEILKPQAEFLYEMEKELIEIAKTNGIKLIKKEAGEKLAQQIEVDESGNIVKIDFSMMELERLPSLDKLTNLDQLDCYNNNLTNLPSLDKLTNLQTFSCAGNKLERLPSLDKLTSLEELICNANKLASLPSLNKLTNLKKLICDSNKFSEQEEAKIISQVPDKCKVRLHI